MNWLKGFVWALVTYAAVLAVSRLAVAYGPAEITSLSASYILPFLFGAALGGGRYFGLTPRVSFVYGTLTCWVAAYTNSYGEWFIIPLFAPHILICPFVGWAVGSYLSARFSRLRKAPALDGFHLFRFSEGGIDKNVYRAGSGPAVVLLHELPGMVPECVELGRKLVKEGYSVYMPLLFGEPMKNYGTKPLLWPCVWKEFSFLSSKGKSPAADWMRALARLAHKERGGKGVAAIGMCFTGRFALSLMMDKELIAPVICQPGSGWKESGLGIPDDEWENAKARSKAEGIPVLGMRFDGDFLCKSARFDTLKEGLGENFREVVVPGKKHSVLTIHFKDLSEADRVRVWNELTAFLKERLS